jgi:hypothetical protein
MTGEFFVTIILQANIECASLTLNPNLLVFQFVYVDYFQFYYIKLNQKNGCGL